MNRMLRSLSSLAVALAVLLMPLMAQAQQGAAAPYFDYFKAFLRNTTAANTVAREANWNRYTSGQSALNNSQGALTDSLSFRRSVITAATTPLTSLADTTVAFPASLFPQPPTWAAHGAASGSRIVAYTPNATSVTLANARDSIGVDSLDTTPWITIRVRQDTLSYATTLTSALDTIAVTAQWSPDGGATWIAIGTPTRAFYATQVTGASEDGTTPPFLIGVEPNGAADYAVVALKCHPNLYGNATATVNDRTLCMCGGLIRFIVYVSNDATGQFSVDIGHWAYANSMHE